MSTTVIRKTLLVVTSVCGLGGAGLLSVHADPPADWPPAYMTAGEALIDHTYYLSKPAYNGSYYTTAVRPDEKTFCQLNKTLEDYTRDGELTKKTITTYDLALVDPDSIKKAYLGGVEFRAFGGESVFKMKVVEGGSFEADIPADTIGVQDEAEDLQPTLQAIKSMVELCGQAETDDQE